jgi:hypothetical protein
MPKHQTPNPKPQTLTSSEIDDAQGMEEASSPYPVANRVVNQKLPYHNKYQKAFPEPEREGEGTNERERE